MAGELRVKIRGRLNFTGLWIFRGRRQADLLYGTQAAVRPQEDGGRSGDGSRAEIDGQGAFPGQAEGLAVGGQIVRAAVFEAEKRKVSPDLAVDPFVPGLTLLSIAKPPGCR